MSDYLRDILGVGKNSPDNSAPLFALVAADIPSVDGEGANKGYWRRQLRDPRTKRFIPMFGGIIFSINLPGIGDVKGTGHFIGNKSPGVATIRVKGHRTIPDGDYQVPHENILGRAKAILNLKDSDSDLQPIEDKKVELRKEIDGEEVLGQLKEDAAFIAKDEGRFPVVRSKEDIYKAAKAQYEHVFDALKREQPDLVKEFSDYNSFWDYASKNMAAHFSTRYKDSVKDIDPLTKATNEIYARDILGLDPNGLITFYRNAVNPKNDQASAAAGYASLDKRMAWNYNSNAQDDKTTGRYIIKAKPGEVTGLLGYSDPTDEYGVVIGPDITSQEDRIERVGDLAWMPINPLMDPDINGSTTGNSAFRNFRTPSNFDFPILDSHPFPPEKGNWQSWYAANNYEVGAIPSKYNELYGEGAFQRDFPENKGAPSYKDFSENAFTQKDGKVAFNPLYIDNHAPSDGAPKAGDDKDKLLKFISTVQELSGKPFLVSREHPKDDSRLKEVNIVETPEVSPEHAGDSPMSGVFDWNDYTPSNSDELAEQIFSVATTNGSSVEELAKANDNYNPELESTYTQKDLEHLAKKFISELIASWNGNSTVDPRSRVLQHLASKVFDLKNTSEISELTSHEKFLLQSKEKQYVTFLNSMYATTQKWLSDRGIKEVPLYRGFRPEGVVDILDEVTPIDGKVRPISSWTTNPNISKSFAGSHGIVMKSFIPADQVLSIPMTGFGVWNEQEFVVLGLPENINAINAYSEKFDNLINLDNNISIESIDDIFNSDDAKKIFSIFSEKLDNKKFGNFDVKLSTAKKTIKTKTLNGQDTPVIEFSGVIEQDGANVGKFSRYIYKNSDGSYSVVHDGIDLKPEYRGKGFGTEFGKFSDEMYKDLGISRIELTAGGENGSYAWAKAGYSWSSEPKNVISSINYNINVLNQPNSSFAEKDKEDILKALNDLKARFESSKFGDSDYPTPAEVANLKSGTYDLGRWILGDEIRWDGFKDLTDRSAEKSESDGRPTGELPEANAPDEEPDPFDDLEFLDEPKAEPEVEDTNKLLDFSNFKKVSERKGHTEGGIYEDPKTGKKYYVKIQDTRHGDNEALASALYNEAGLDSLKVMHGKLNNKDVTYTEWRDNLTPIKERISNISSDDPALDGFAIDAWLANWDTVGAGDFGGFDNIAYDENGNPVRLDAGGALLYRGAGTRKGNLFKKEVDELDSFKDPKFTTGKLFENITPEKEKASVERLAAITPEKIDELIDEHITNPEDNQELKEKLKARRDYILEHQKGVEMLMNKDKNLNTLRTTQNFSDSDKSAILDYTNAGYRRVNRYLRDPNNPEYEKYKESAEKLNSIIEANNLTEDTTLYRIIGNLNGITYEPGDIIEDSGIQSTTKMGFGSIHSTVMGKLYPEHPLGSDAAEFLGYTRFKINAPAGTKALDVTEISMFKEEGEIILPSRTKLRVVSSKITPMKEPYTGQYRDVVLEVVNEPKEPDLKIEEPNTSTSSGESDLLDKLVNGTQIDRSVIYQTKGIPVSFEVEDIPEQQHYALRSYTSLTYEPINKALRSGEKVGAIYEKDIDGIDQLIQERGTVSSAGTVYRGIRGSTVESLDSKEPGDIVSEPGFTSTTSDGLVALDNFSVGKNVNGSYDASQGHSVSTAFWSITVPEGSKALALPEDGYKHGGEKEVLLPRDSKFKINAIRKVPQIDPDTKKENGRFNYFVDATVVPQSVETTESIKDSKTLLDEVITPENIFLVNNLTDLVVSLPPLKGIEADELLPKEHTALTEYIGNSTYKAINGILRGEDYNSDDFSDEQLQEFIDSINGLFDRHPKTVNPSVVFRGFNFSEYQTEDIEKFKNLQVGDIIEDPGFVSTSKDPRIAWDFGPGKATIFDKKVDKTPEDGAGGVFIIINVPTGSKIIPVNITETYNEKEVLLPSDSKFKIKNIKTIPVTTSAGEPTEYVNHYMEVDLVLDNNSNTSEESVESSTIPESESPELMKDWNPLTGLD